MTVIDVARPRSGLNMSGRRQSVAEAEQEGYVSLGRSALRHWVIVSVAVAAGVLFGIGAGAVITPTYSARAELIVGKSLDLTNTAAISGFPSAEAQLAEDYARLAATPSFASALAKTLGHPPAGSVSASAVPQSPVIDVYGEARSQAAATALANAGSAAMIQSINTVNQQTTSASQGLLAQYRAQAMKMEQDQQAVGALQAQVAASSGTARADLEQQLAAASATVDTDKFRLNAIGSEYAAQFNPSLAIEQAVTALGGAYPQGGNRKTHIEIGAIAGIVSGFVLGLAMAASMDVRADRRARRYFNFPTSE
ncbi:MAG TPA: hypothetical protein VFP54_13040 [Acidimicrobiales bacterium]|nr:hypothetical protein [Acidimicrobiales bacterium]